MNDELQMLELQCISSETRSQFLGSVGWTVRSGKGESACRLKQQDLSND